MFSSEEIEEFNERITRAGLLLTQESPEGPNGEVTWTFSSEVVDFEVGDDRDFLFVAVGPRGSTTYTMATWAKVLGIDPPESPKFGSQLAYALENLNRMTRAIETGGNIRDALLEANWELVKKRLNLDPNMPRPGQGVPRE